MFSNDFYENVFYSPVDPLLGHLTSFRVVFVEISGYHVVENLFTSSVLQTGINSEFRRSGNH
ncbi:hypothetical protein LINPERPRIM_LOCUS38086 [Linum perenne]